MAEGGYEMTAFGRPDNIAGVGETSFTDPAEAPLVMSPSYQRIEGRLKEKIQSSTGDELSQFRQELLKNKVDAFFKAVATKTGLLPANKEALPYDDFELQETTLYLKDGDRRVRVTNSKNSAEFFSLRYIGGAKLIRKILPDYTTTRRLSTAQRAALTAVKEQVPAASERIESTELPQCTSDVDTAVIRLASDADTNTDNEDALPLRELLGLDKAMRRQRGALVYNLARLSQLDGDITQAEQELEGEEAANDPEKSDACKGYSTACATSGHPAWRWPLRTVRPFAHSSLASGRQSSGRSMKTQY